MASVGTGGFVHFQNANGGAMFGKSYGDRSPYPATSSRDDRNLAIQA